MIYSLLVAIAIWTAYYYWTKYNNEQRTNRQIEINYAIDKTKIKLNNVEENLYRELRHKALSTTAEQLNLKLDAEKTIVYGVVMECDTGVAVVTLVAFKSGDASIYLSTGQIYIGGYSHENIRTAALAFVDEAQNYVKKAKITYYTEELGKNCVSFYLLTNKQTFKFQDTVKNLTIINSEWKKLFYMGDNLVAEYSKIVDKQNEDLPANKDSGGSHGLGNKNPG
jgi:hypothetical protein